MTEIEAARMNGRSMAWSLGVRVFLYTRQDGKLVFHALNPHPDATTLTLVETFEAPAASTPTAFPEAPKIAAA